MNTNVVVIGAGPVGIITACTLKAINQNAKVTVVDKRPDPKRNHGLHIDRDSISKINSIMDNALKNNAADVDPQFIQELKTKLNKWKNSFVRTTTIEKEIAQIAQDHGIVVERNKDFNISAEPGEGTISLDQLLDEEIPDDLTDDQKRLRDIVQDASIIIGADGAHSEVRKAVMGDRLVDQKTMQYVIELKYQSDGKANPRNLKEQNDETFKFGNIDIESMNKKETDEPKPVTLHIFVNKATYDSLRVVDQQGKLKGVFGNSWTLDEIKEMGKNDLNIDRISKTFEFHLKGLRKRGGSCSEEKISTLDLTVFRSEESVKNYKGKQVLLVGDANSGMILERGVNKGIMEAGLCAEAISSVIRRDADIEENKVPQEFTDYQNKTRDIYKKEKLFAEFKNFWIQIARKIVAFIANKIVVLFKPKKHFRTHSIWNEELVN